MSELVAIMKVYELKPQPSMKCLNLLRMKGLDGVLGFWGFGVLSFFITIASAAVLGTR